MFPWEMMKLLEKIFDEMLHDLDELGPNPAA